MSQEGSTDWSRPSGFIWSMIGSAVGFANIIAFSAQCYKNGGGAFLLPFLLAMAILGLPMLMLESMMGHEWKTSLVGAYGRVGGERFKIFGWMSILACLTIGGFYTVLTGYSLAYIYFAATGAFTGSAETFFQHTFLGLTPNLETVGSLSLGPFFATVCVLVLTGYVLYKGVRQGIEAACSLFLPLLFFLILALLVASFFLPGAFAGYLYFLTPNFSKLLEITLWRDVFGHLFFSFSLGLGIVVGYCRYTGENIDLVPAMRWVAFGDFLISMLAGLAVFGAIGYMSEVQQIPFSQIVTSDSIFQIGFIVFPELLESFGPMFAQSLGTLFFFCVFVAGITGVFSIVEAVVGNFECALGMSREASLIQTLGLLSILASIFCLGNGLHIVDAIVPMVMGLHMLIGGLAQIYVFAFRSRRLSSHVLWQKDRFAKMNRLSLLYVAPPILLMILVSNLVLEFQVFHLATLVRWIWFVIALGLSVVLSRKKTLEKPGFVAHNQA